MVSFVFCSTKDLQKMLLGKQSFLPMLFLKNKDQTSQKNSEQCFSGKMKPTCQNSAIFEHFQKWPKNLVDIFACSHSI